jgi:translation initiation factor 2 subunit 3
MKRMNKELSIINVGIFGHIDHGKTTLLKKLSGKWTDTHSEELKRGITIKLGYADAVIYSDDGNFNITKNGKEIRRVSYIDAPGHEMLMATTLSGAALIDAAILVVAANEGIQAQTREHLMVLQAKGVGNLIIVQNKIDLVDVSEARKNYEEIKKLLGTKYSNVEIIPVSAQQGVNISEVLRAIVEVKIEERDLNTDPRFVIARSFDVNRPGVKPGELKGAVLGGALICGKLKVGDEIEIKPGRKYKEGSMVKYEGISTKVLGLFRGADGLNFLTPGGSSGVETALDMSLGSRDGLGGNVAGLKGKVPDPTLKVKLKYELFSEVFGTGKHLKVEEIKKGETLMLSVGTSTTGGTVGNIVSGLIEIDLKVPAVVFLRDNVGIARNVGGHWRLIGFGEIA